MNDKIPTATKMVTVEVDGRTFQVPESVITNNIVYVGLDVHKDSISACCFTKGNETFSGEVRIEPTAGAVVKYLNKMRRAAFAEGTEFIVAYEAGGAGYSLYRALKDKDVDCIILAPTTMKRTIQEEKMKTDKRDARMIARCLAYGMASQVTPLSEEDESVRDYIRMRDDHKKELKRVKQEIIAFCRRKGLEYTETKSYWTQAHVKWLDNVDLREIDRASLDEYMITYRYLQDRISTMDGEIAKLAQRASYAELVADLRCLAGIDTHVALALVSEIGDFKRFAKPMHLASFLGLVPAEYSSGASQNKGGLTKAGNSHLRRLLLEAANCGYSARSTPGAKSKALKDRQEGRSSKVIAYADRANMRLRKRARRMVVKEGKNANVVKAAIARELACFIWGIATGNIA